MLAGLFSEGVVSVFHILLSPPGAWLVMVGVLGVVRRDIYTPTCPVTGAGSSVWQKKATQHFRSPWIPGYDLCMVTEPLLWCGCITHISVIWAIVFQFWFVSKAPRKH